MPVSDQSEKTDDVAVSLQIYVARSECALPANLEHDYLAMLSADSRASIIRFARWQDRQAALFGKLLLLKVVQTQYPDTWLQKLHSLERNHYGKPFFQAGPEFSLSHSGSLVILVVSDDIAVGVDIEKIEPVDVDDFSQHLPEIVTLFAQHPEDYATTLFFDCWTQKEAVLKGAGVGLSVPLTDVVINGTTASLHDTTWHISRLGIDKQYSCHVATRQPLQQLAVEHIDLMRF